jgi:hypothetical protein
MLNGIAIIQTSSCLETPLKRCMVVYGKNLLKVISKSSSLNPDTELFTSKIFSILEIKIKYSVDVPTRILSGFYNYLSTNYIIPTEDYKDGRGKYFAEDPNTIANMFSTYYQFECIKNYGILWNTIIKKEGSSEPVELNEIPNLLRLKPNKIITYS